MSTNRTLRILLVFLAAVCTHCAIAAPSNTASEPNLNQIQAAFDAEVRCELSDPIGLLAELPLAILSDMQSKAMHADATELNLLISNDSWLLKDYVITRQLRQGGKFDLAEVYRQDCSHRTSSTQRRAISQLKIADAVAKADFAWVPLLGNGNEYLGPGLVFVRENNQWRYLELVSATLGSTAKNRQLVQELRTVVRDDADDIAEFIRICNMPKAPQPKMSFDFAKAYQRDISAEIYGDTEFDPKNALGALQRTAVRRHAEGKQVAPSAVAQLLFAEVLIRSLEFASAPSAATPQWLSRVTRAQQFFEQAHARGADLASFLPLIPWLADVNLQGSGTHPIDLSKAQQLYKIAAAAGNTEAAAIYAHFQTTGFAATPVD